MSVNHGNKYHCKTIDQVLFYHEIIFCDALHCFGGLCAAECPDVPFTITGGHLYHLKAIFNPRNIFILEKSQ